MLSIAGHLGDIICTFIPFLDIWIIDHLYSSIKLYMLFICSLQLRCGAAFQCIYIGATTCCPLTQLNVVGLGGSKAGFGAASARMNGAGIVKRCVEVVGTFRSLPCHCPKQSYLEGWQWTSSEFIAVVFGFKLAVETVAVELLLVGVGICLVYRLSNQKDYTRIIQWVSNTLPYPYRSPLATYWYSIFSLESRGVLRTVARSKASDPAGVHHHRTS